MKKARWGRFLVVLTALLLLPHCSGPFREGGSVSRVLKPDEFPEEIMRLEERAHSAPDPLQRASAHRRLAELFSSRKNLSVNYTRAFEELRMAAELDPKGSSSDSFTDWLALLTEIDRLTRKTEEIERRMEELVRKSEDAEALRGKTAGENRALRNENSELRAAIGLSAKEDKGLRTVLERLTKENAELRSVVEQLKDLDIRLEEKRRNLR